MNQNLRFNKNHNTENTENQQNNSHYFSPTPNWLQKRREISHLAKLLYGLLKQYAAVSGVAFPHRDRLANDLSTSLRSIDRALKELRDNNLIFSIRRGSNKPTQYCLPNHIWMANAPTYTSTKQEKKSTTSAVCMDSPRVARPYIDDKIIINNIYNNNIPIPRMRANVPKFEGDFEKFMAEHPRPGNRLQTYSAFLRAIELIDPQRLIEKAAAYASSLTLENEKKFCIGSARWLEEQHYRRDYGRHDAEYWRKYTKSFENKKNVGKNWVSPTKDELDKVDELLRKNFIKRKITGLEILKREGA